jgi:hypothetical protein
MNDNWYVARNKTRLGPFSKSHIESKVKQNKLLPTDLLWHKSFGNEWKSFSVCRELFVKSPAVSFNTSNLIESHIVDRFDKSVRQSLRFDSSFIRNLCAVLTGLGLTSAFLPWKSMGVFSMNCLQLSDAWFFITPFIAAGVWLCLNWHNFKVVPSYVGLYSLIMLAMLVACYDQFSVILPFTQQTRNVAGMGYYVCAFCLLGIAVSSMSSVSANKAD